MGKAVNKLLKEIKKYLSPGARVVIACSGGADSVSLTDAVWQLRDECGYKIAVMHVEHGLRGEEALHDAAFSEKFCEERGLDFACRHVKAGAYAEAEGLSVEDAARKLRYRELWQYVDELCADFLLTAHHAGDQAETVLMQLLRGSGTAGLGGMQVQAGRLMRPLLFVQRSEIEAYCRKRNLSFCYDSTNDDVRYTRNRIRKELLPYLQQQFNPQLVTALGQTAQLAAMDNAFAFHHAQKFYGEHVAANGKLLECGVEKLLAEFNAVSTRVIRLMWEQKAAPGSELGFEHIKAVLRLLQNGSSGKAVMLPGKTAAAYSYGKLYIGARADIEKLLNGEGDSCSCDITVMTKNVADGVKINLPEGGKLLLSIADTQQPVSKTQAVVPLELAGKTVCIRTRRDGDRFYPYGSAGSKKLKDYFIDNKVPRAERDGKLLVTAGGNVLWIIGERQAGWKHEAAGKWLVMRLINGKDGQND